ncbi:hypothetical protein HFP15_40675 [Amycolatopsis sp. K13G38]|uniref:Uncharacterized protein n=1 Tax=Amycolatopsis acididurans TaxID=2724524 RepID=A0ABX1JHA1_9PSEU|nr:hypothetical protein [Amycolatopsis acididurans]NKQ59175.1 hypothetical protein [Amycolatopsis acididurans]
MIDYENADNDCVREFAALLDDVAPMRVAWLLGAATIRSELSWHRARQMENGAPGR